MSKKQHEKQLAAARQKRRSSRLDRRTSRNRVIILAMAVLLVVSLLGGALTGIFGGADDPATAQGDDTATDATEASSEPQAAPCGPTPDDVPEVTSAIYDEPFELSIDPEASYVATLETTCGDVVIELDAENAPLAVNNLVNLAEDGYYDGVEFHRVISGFVIQVGDPAGTGCGREDCTVLDPELPSFPGYTFADELAGAEALYDQVRGEAVERLRAIAEEEGEELDDEVFEMLPGGYPRGTVAMANAGPDTNGSQFFVAHGDPTGLPGPNYTVLGTVIEGMDVVDRIAASPTGEGDRPLESIVLRTVRIEQR